MCFLLLFGAIPCAFQFATEQLFVQPKLIDVPLGSVTSRVRLPHREPPLRFTWPRKALSATLIPDFAPPSHRRWLPWPEAQELALCRVTSLVRCSIRLGYTRCSRAVDFLWHALQIRSVQSQSMELGTKSRPYLLLLDPGVSRLTVTPKYQQTTRLDRSSVLGGAHVS